MKTKEKTQDQPAGQKLELDSPDLENTQVHRRRVLLSCTISEGQGEGKEASVISRTMLSEEYWVHLLAPRACMARLLCVEYLLTV